METKFCKYCNTTRPITDFRTYKKVHKNGSSNIYLRNECRSCMNKRAVINRSKNLEKYREIGRKSHQKHKVKRNQQSKAYREKNPQKFSAMRKNWNESPRGKAMILFNSAKNRANKLNLEFDLDVTWIQNKIEDGHCEVTGMTFDLSSTNKYTFSPTTPSLDKIDPSKGYTKDNVRVVVFMYNVAKNEWSDLEILNMARALVNRHS